MNSIFAKNRLIHALFFLFFANLLLAKVNPQPGENLWRLTARIGDCVDVADTKLDLLASQNDVICSKVEKVDDDLFTHNDVVCSKLEDISSVVEGTQDGVEAICSKVEDLNTNLSVHDALICSKIEQVDTKQDLLLSVIDSLEFIGECETLVFQSDIPFTIDSPGFYCLAESVNFATGTAITIASDNVVLDLQDKKIDGSLGGDIGIAINSGLQNITIQNGSLCNMNNKGIDADATNNIAFISMSVSDSLIDSIIDMPAFIAPITCLQIKDVKVLNVGQFKVFPIISVIDSLIDSIVDSPDCVLSAITGIHLNCVNEAVIENCKVLNCIGDGFALQGVENGILQSSLAIKNGGNGFVLDNTDTSCFKWCKATMNCFHGFCDLACNGDNAYLGCLSKQNGIHGFNIIGSGKEVKECIASQNVRDGFHLSRSLLKDGALDIIFGDAGKVVTSFGEGDSGNGIAVQKDGKILVAGDSDNDFALARYNPDGSLDETFGLGGKVITDFGGFDFCSGVVVQKDGKIVLAGVSSVEGDNDFALARYNAKGNLDETFGVGGKVITNFGGNDIGRAVVLQKDGKIVVVGISNAEGDNDFALARYNTDGSLDETFGVGGRVTTNFNGSAIGNAVVVQKNGKIIVAGGSGFDFALARYSPDGNLDETFGVGGKVITSFSGFGVGNAVVVQKDGKIIVVGGADSDFALVRYNTNGSLDSRFGTGGKVITNFSGSDSSVGNAIVVQKDGKIVVAGRLSIGVSSDFAIARYVVFKQGVAIRNCVAEENGEDGFSIAGRAYNVRNSTAIHNVANGFLLDSLTDSCQLLSNESLQNNNIGIENLGIDNQLFNNKAHSNAGGNYVGVPLVTIPTPLTSFWANAEV